MMHSESPKLVQWYTEEANNIIRGVKLFPKTFRGVCICRVQESAPRMPALPRKCVKEQGFVGCLLEDPGKGWHQTPPLGDRYWYPLYEKLCELISSATFILQAAARC
jgi:predicted TIM-barrel fold metal-dependent hydrolase